MGREQEEEGKRDNLRIVKRECIMCEWKFAYFFLLFLRAKEKKLAKVENGWEENDKKNV